MSSLFINALRSRRCLLYISMFQALYPCYTRLTLPAPLTVCTGAGTNSMLVLNELAPSLSAHK